MRLDYSAHARLQMRRRDITEAEVEATVREPDDRVPADSSTDACMKGFGHRLVIVRLDRFANPVRIISVADEWEGMAS